MSGFPYRVYRMLREFGHTSERCADLIIKARLGDVFALAWIRAIRKHAF